MTNRIGRGWLGWMWLLLLMGLTGRGAGQVTSPAAVMHPVLGTSWTEPTLRAAYVKVRPWYAVEPGSRRIVRAGDLGAFPLQGTLRDHIRAGRILVDSADGRQVAVQCDPRVAATLGTNVDLVVCRKGTPWLSYESSADNRRSLPFFHDVTLSYEEFITSLQRGYHYPEVPELGTRAGRKGAFRTERVKVNKVEDP